MAWADDSEQLARFMEYAAGNCARELGRLHGQHDRFWQARYASILITKEPEAQIARLRYFLEQGCKENLVSSPRHWPGIHPAKAFLSGKPMQGIWIDRSGFTNASRSKGKTPRLIDFHKKETLTLSPLPCWAHLSPEAYRQKVRDLIEEIEKETAERHRINNTKPAGRRAVLRKSPRHKSQNPKKRPLPLVHATTKQARETIRAAYREFVKHFRATAENLKDNKPTHGYPEGAFPSPLPFVPAAPILNPG